ncbi:MAG: hypothetical protein EB034_25960 [Verrucomicrobia bacterium]|nr:hypothetical protein [Verrucomicrobiota bacterium]
MKRTRHSPEQIATKLRQAATHLACKAKHTVDLATEAVVSATVTTDRSDSQTGPGTLVLAQAALIQSSNHVAITEVVADKGYHDNSCWPTARSCWCAPIFLSGSKSTGGLAPVVFWCYAVPDRRLTAPELFRSLQERLRTTHWRGGGNKSQILRLGVL